MRMRLEVTVRVGTQGVAIGLLRIRAEAADHDRLTAREDSGEPRERGVPDARSPRVGVHITELAAAVRTCPRSACPAPEPGFAGDRRQQPRRSCPTRSSEYIWPDCA